MNIRQLTPEDAAPFWQLRLQALLQFPEAFGASYEESSELPLSRVRERLAPAAGQAVFGAFTGDGELAGMTGLRGETSAKLRHKAMIWGVYVAPGHQGRGLGKKLLQAAIDYARTVPHLEQLHLSVVSTNPSALRLYRSVGFETYGQEKRALKVGSVYYDEDLMMLRL